MVTPSTLKRLERARLAVARLEKALKIEDQQYLRDYDLQSIVERNLQISVEAVVDLAQRLITLKRWRTPNSYGDVARVLEKNRVLPKELCSQLEDLASLRNIIVHLYAEVDQVRLLRELPDSVKYLKVIIKVLVEYVEREGLDP